MKDGPSSGFSPYSRLVHISTMYGVSVLKACMVSTVCLVKSRQTEDEVGRQHQGMDRPGVWQVPEGSGEQGKMEKTGRKIICGARMTLTLRYR